MIGGERRGAQRSRRRWTPEEIALALRLWRQEGLSYKRIGHHLGRNHSSVGYVIRREDLAEEARLVAEESKDQDLGG